MGTIMRAALATIAVTAPAGAEDIAAVTARGRTLSDWSSLDSITALAAAASPEFRDLIKAAGGPATLVAAVNAQMGAERQRLDEVSTRLNGLSIYRRLSVFERIPAAMSVVIWDEKGQVLAAGVTPSAPPPAPSGRASVSVRPPFATPRQGSWYTFWGGGNLARNYHMVAPSQLHAYDLLVVKDGRSFSGPAVEHASYYCWGEPVLAVADGVVTEAVDGLPDMPIGDISSYTPAGNHVVVRHGAEQHSLVAHLQKGSTRVKTGDRVKAGQLLGLCGNSGRTSEPHIHFQLQTGPSFSEGGAGIPTKFQGLLVDGHPAKDGEPVRGQFIEPTNQLSGN